MIDIYTRYGYQFSRYLEFRTGVPFISIKSPPEDLSQAVTGAPDSGQPTQIDV